MTVPAGALVPPGTDLAFHVGLHQHLQHRLRDTAQEVTISCFRQQVRQWQSLLGHRVLGRSGVGASQLHASRQVRWPPKPYIPANTGFSTTSAALPTAEITPSRATKTCRGPKDGRTELSEPFRAHVS